MCHIVIEVVDCWPEGLHHCRKLCHIVIEVLTADQKAYTTVVSCLT
jgi:hypothetical protein